MERPPHLFTYSTCRDCGGLLHVTDHDTTHPGCTPKPTKVERLAEQWLAAVESGDTAREEQLYPQIMELDDRPPRLLDAALMYVSWGWSVFPLKARSKQPATRHGFKDATNDPERVRTWWTRHPDSNIGLPTGLVFDVIDVDVPRGPISLTTMLEQDAMPDVHGHVATASGGAHFYTPPTGRGNSVNLLPGIDYRGAGGYVVAPPSTLGERGRAWSWVSTPSPTLREVCA